MFIKVTFPSGPFYINSESIKYVQLDADQNMIFAYIDGEVVSVPKLIWCTAIIMTLEAAWTELNAI